MTAIVFLVGVEAGEGDFLPLAVYRKMPLLCVMLPPLGNTFSEGTITLSVTIIMSQFRQLTLVRAGV